MKKHQDGSLTSDNGAWRLRWRETLKQPDGSLKRIRRSITLGPTRELKKHQAQALATEHLARILPHSSSSSFAVTFHDFVNTEYFAHVRASLAKSTVNTYEIIWRTHAPVVPPEWRMREIRTVDCQHLLRAIQKRSPNLTKLTLAHIKAFFSSIFSHALRLGVISHGNPMQHTTLPEGRESEDTYAYSPEEITRMLSILPEPANLVVLLLACTGLRRSEARGLRWSDYDPISRTLHVRGKYLSGEYSRTKSKASKAPVPVVSPLASRLNLEYQRQRIMGSTIDDQPIFPSRIPNVPLDLHNLATRVIKPAFKAHGLAWHGFHAFRRGLGTFLHSQGVPDIEIQSILRHESVEITQKSYVKAIAPNIRKAMEIVTFDIPVQGKLQ